MTYEELIKNNEKLVYLVLKKLNLYDQLDEYYDIGIIGLCNAARIYDKSKKSKFSTLACTCIKNSILCEIRNNKKKIYMNSLSLDAPIDANHDDILLEDIIPCDYNFENKIAEKDDINTLYKILYKLNDDEKKLIYLYFFKELNQIEISNILKISQVSVSRRIKNTIHKLQKYYRQENK